MPEVLCIEKSETALSIEECLKELDSPDDAVAKTAAENLANFQGYQFRLNKNLLLFFEKEGSPCQKTAARILIQTWCK